MRDDFHVDMSGRIYKRMTIGIACVGTNTDIQNGCALKGNLIKFIQKNLCAGSVYEEHAKIYAICIYLLIKDKMEKIENLIICNDEDFDYVKEYLLILIGDTPHFKIINISELRKKLNRNIGSLADNYAKHYRKRALKKNKWNSGKKLNVVEIDYNTIKKHWEKLK